METQGATMTNMNANTIPDSQPESSSTTLFRPVASLSLLDGEENNKRTSAQEEDVMMGGFLRPEYGDPSTDRRSSPARLSSPGELAAHRFTAWRGILRFRKSQQNLLELAHDEEGAEKK